MKDTRRFSLQQLAVCRTHVRKIYDKLNLFTVYGSVENGQKSKMLSSSMVISHRNMNVEVPDQTMVSFSSDSQHVLFDDWKIPVFFQWKKKRQIKHLYNLLSSTT